MSTDPHSPDPPKPRSRGLIFLRYALPALIVIAGATSRAAARS
jgi:hypothetical protein